MYYRFNNLGLYTQIWFSNLGIGFVTYLENHVYTFTLYRFIDNFVLFHHIVHMLGVCSYMTKQCMDTSSRGVENWSIAGLYLRRVRMDKTYNASSKNESLPYDVAL